MNSAEQTVERFLIAQFKTVVYEPDGNVPPDFVADGRIAINLVSQQRTRTQLCFERRRRHTMPDRWDGNGGVNTLFPKVE